MSPARGSMAPMADGVAVQHRVPPFVLVSGPEGLLAERGVDTTLDELRVTHPDLEVIRLYAAAYQAGELVLHASPSLFGGAKCIVVHDLDEAPDDLQTDLLALLGAEPEPEQYLVVLHKSGTRGKKVLDTLRGAGARVIDAPAVKTDRDKTDFAAHEFRRQRLADGGEAYTMICPDAGLMQEAFGGAYYQAACPSEIHYRHLKLYRALRCERLDAFEVEEIALNLLADVSEAFGASPGVSPAGPAVRRRLQAAQSFIAADPAADHRLSEVARIISSRASPSVRSAGDPSRRSATGAELTTNW